MGQPAITLVVPLYNGRPLIDELLPTIKAQEPDIHSCIFIDDASSDGTLGVVRSFGLERAVILENEANIGLYATLNRALGCVETELVGLIFQDDILIGPFAAEMSRLAQRHPDAGFFTAGFARIEPEGAVIDTSTRTGREWIQNPGLASWRHVLLDGTSWIISGSVSRLSALRKYGFRADLPHCADFDIFSRAAREDSFIYLDKTLVGIREHPAQASVGNLANSTDLREKILVIGEQHRRWGPDFGVRFRSALLARYMGYVVARAVGQLRRGRFAAARRTTALAPRLLLELLGRGRER